MSFLSRFRNRSANYSNPQAVNTRRTFFRRMGGLSMAALGAGILTADDTWAAVEERADRFGIEPGTLVDAKGRPLAHEAGMPAEPLLGEIMLVPFNFAPRGWAFCEGQLLSISSNTALFSLLGTTYGGDGRSTFGLPDLRGRYAMSSGTGPGLSARSLGQKSGVEQVVLTTTQLPSHTHTSPFSDGPGTLAGAHDRVVPDSQSNQDTSTGATGGGQAHDNMPPFLVLNYCIALVGIFPSRN